MKVVNKNSIKIMIFGDLKEGDVFTFIKDSSVNLPIYMKCGEKPGTRYAVNLETGILYTYDHCSPVMKIDGEFNIKQEK